MSASRFKYPRTPHLPWSPGVSDDDVRIVDLQCFEGRNIVVTEKMDGENTTMYADYLHARSIDGRHHPSRDWVKQLHASVGHMIPEGWRICGENLYARHSVAYDSLRSYFYMFSIWNERNICLDWDETLEWSALLGFELPRVLYRGGWDEGLIRDFHIDTETMEGYVVRNEQAFPYTDFMRNIAKWVRKGHVQTDEHWMFARIVPNGLEGEHDRDEKREEENT